MIDDWIAERDALVFRLTVDALRIPLVPRLFLFFQNFCICNVLLQKIFLLHQLTVMLNSKKVMVVSGGWERGSRPSAMAKSVAHVLSQR